MRWSEEVSEVEFAVHYRGKEISNGSSYESLPKWQRELKFYPKQTERESKSVTSNTTTESHLPGESLCSAATTRQWKANSYHKLCSGFRRLLINVNCLQAWQDMLPHRCEQKPVFPDDIYWSSVLSYRINHVWLYHVVKNWKYAFPVTERIHIHSHCIVIHFK